MKNLFYFLLILISSCSTNPYKSSEKEYKSQLRKLNEELEKKGTPVLVNHTVVEKDSSQTTYYNHLSSFKDTIVNNKSVLLPNGISTEWIGTVNFNLRKPNFIIIHHTAQDSLGQTIKTFTTVKTQVSSHYIISKDGRVIHMLNDYLRSWHAGVSSWGRNTDMNSASIGIELDNNGKEPFAEAQIGSLIALLTRLQKDYKIPPENIIGHSDIAPSRKNDPSAFFPWKLLASNNFGVWPDEKSESAPENFDIEMALQIIGYNTQILDYAIIAFKLHYIPENINAVLDQNTIDTIYAVYKKVMK